MFSDKSFTLADLLYGRNGTDHGDDDVDVLVMAPGPHQQFGGQDGHQDDGVQEEAGHSQTNQQGDYDLVTSVNNGLIFCDGDIKP